MWAEAMNKLEGMDSTDRERLWPELVHGFKDLSRRVKVRFSLSPFLATEYRPQIFDELQKLLLNHVLHNAGFDLYL
jgi:nuclear pore complex protein Nup54